MFRHHRSGLTCGGTTIAAARGGPFPRSSSSPASAAAGPAGAARRRPRGGPALLRERPMHGYEMIQELQERSGGVWRPSAGSIYPTLQLLEDEGLVAARRSTASAASR